MAALGTQQPVQIAPVQTVPDTHNSSAQDHVARNPDPALDRSHEHHHPHVHHDAFAEKGREDEVVYSQGTTSDRSNIPDQNPMNHGLHQRHHDAKGEVNIGDSEKGLSPIRSQDDDQKPSKFSGFYTKYRIFFHLFIWLVFTGYVTVSYVGQLSFAVLINHHGCGRNIS